jgi:Tfp pilus assembly protein PilF
LALAAGTVNPSAVKLLLKKDAQVARGETANVEALLAKATEIDPEFATAQMQLAVLFEARNEHSKAIERYRRVLAVEADNAVVLNNLAYSLAVHEGKPQEALPYAEHAYRLEKQSGYVADTVGWIHHLLGDDRTGLFFLEQAVRTLPANPDVLIHTATVYLNLRDTSAARATFAAAEKLGRPTTDRDDYKALRDRLKTP